MALYDVRGGGQQSNRAWMGAGRGRAVLSGLQLGRDAQTGTSLKTSKRPLCQPVRSFLAGAGVLFIMMTCGCGAIIMTCGCCCSGCIAYCGAYCCGCGEIGAGRAA